MNPVDIAARVRHPLLALDRLSALCDGEIFIQCAILDDYSPYLGGLGHGYPREQMVMEFCPGSQYWNNITNGWAPALACLLRMVYAAGFQEGAAWKLLEHPTHVSQCRGFVHGQKLN